MAIDYLVNCVKSIVCLVAVAEFSLCVAQGQTTSFSFTLDEPCKTSAGVYTSNGTLVRTLWSKHRYYASGTYTALWDGLDDNSNQVPAGVYEIKLLQHNTEYLWDGVVGNTSAESSGPTVHLGFWPMADMAISGTNAFYVSGYNEGKYDFRNFLTTDPQHVKMAWYWVYSSQFNRVYSVPGDINDLNWLWVAADSDWVYFAASGTPNPSNPSVPKAHPGCIVACNVADNSPAYFSGGVPIINNGANSPLPNGIYVGTQPGLSGMSVQQNGNLLAVSVAPDNRVYLMDKRAGSSIAQFTVASPGRLSFSPDGSLWVISGTSVICYTNVGPNASPALRIPNFSEPLDVAVNPSNPNLLLVADGGSSQQVKAFNSAGAPIWTYGLAGGYQSNGVAVATNKFWFNDGENDETFIAFAPDGSFWVGDGGNNRSMHFSGSLSYIEQIMYQPHSYIAAVDKNNPNRVFNQFYEFNVDYTQPLSEGWTLVNNWQANVPQVNISWNKGLYEVTTFPNGRTYALVDNNTYTFAMSELCELAPNQLRLTGLYPAWSASRGWISLGPDGSARRTTMGAPTWYEAALTGFDSANNPIWNPEQLIATAPDGATDPVPRCCSFGNVRAAISSNNILISFDQSLNGGWHLGGINVGGNAWLWKASPAVAYMNGCGTYEISNGITYGGDTVEAIDRNVIYGFHGEFFRGQGQAGQGMHFYDDGLFVGQYGEASPGHSAYEGSLPGFAGNGHCPNLTKTPTGDYYLWVNDESDHGPQRWHFVNARNIREQSGTGILGGSIILSQPPPAFPTGLTAKNGDRRAELTWKPVQGASSYNIRYSLMNGGPYNTIATTSTNTDCLFGGLTNGQTYYFAVTGVIGGTEGIPSEQVPVTPFDTTQNVLCAGSMSEGGQFTPVIDVTTTNMNSDFASYVGAEHYTGVLNLRELDYYGYGNLENESVGTQGYAIFDWNGPGSSRINIPGPFTLRTNSGWWDVPYLERQFRIDNVLGLNNGIIAGPKASMSIAVSDTNFHYLTVISPAQYNNPRVFTLELTSTNNTSAVYTLDEAPGLSHVFQFLFSGNVTLTADASGPGGSDAIVQALFFDNAPVTYSQSIVQAAQSTNTTTTLASSPNPALGGAVITFTATVAGSGGTPTGSVDFFNGTHSLATATLTGLGVATFSTTSLPASGSPYSITAVYSGDSDFVGSASTPLLEVITNPAPTGSGSSAGPLSARWLLSEGSGTGAADSSGNGNTGTLINSPIWVTGAPGTNALEFPGASVPGAAYVAVPNSTTLGDQGLGSNITICAWVKRSAASVGNYCAVVAKDVPSDVSPYHRNYELIFDTGSHLLFVYRNSAGTAWVEYSSSRIYNDIANWHFYCVSYTYGVSSSCALYVDGVPAPGSWTSGNGSDAPASTSGGPVLIGIDGTGTAAKGSIYDMISIYNTALTSSQIASLYATGSSSGTTAAATTTSVTSSKNPAPAAAAITLTATVSAAGSIPTGSVAFYSGTASLGNATLNGSGIGTLTTGAFTASGSPYSITAVFGGNTSFASSTSSVLTEVVTNASTSPGPSATVLATSQNPATAGTLVTLTATVTGSGIVPTGNVTFFDGSTNLGASTLNNSGIATFSISTLAASGSPHLITAVYSGNGSFSGSTSGVVSEVISNPAATMIPLVNGSFENPAGARGTVAGTPTGWVASNKNPYGVYNPGLGVYSNVVNDMLPAPAQGSQVLWINAGNYVAQFLTNTMAPNQTYKLSGAIGNRGDGYGLLPTDQDYVNLVVGNTIVAQNVNLVHPAPGTFLAWSISYTSPVAGIPAGTLQIRLGQNGTGEVNYDNIILTVGPAGQ
ncbi:MAG: Ig-like domain repeat protein [Limisphaerales bacterium]